MNKQIILGRKRFAVKSWVGEDFSSLYDEFYHFRQDIQEQTKLQLTCGQEWCLFIDGKSPRLSAIGLSVIGPPVFGVKFKNQEGGPFFEYIIQKGPFEQRFEELLQKAQGFYNELKVKCAQNGEKISSEYMLLVYSHKIALHFFCQNDYIQTSE